ncbi:MAG: histidine phosphatase family protein, partial [Tepidisphaeraceae bacterium]
TGKLVSEAMGVPFEGAPGLEEHDRGNVPVMPTKEFISSIALFFKKRDELVLGKETAAVALDRITRAIDTVQQRHAERNIAVVTHGTVLALFEASHTDADPFLIWRRMGLPSFVVFETPGMTRVGGVDRV